MARGGARRGAGRKAKVGKFSTKIERAEKAIADKLPELVDLAFGLARGVTVKDVSPEGETEYYETKPDLKAITYLVDRIMGKPTERHEHDISHLSDEDLVLLLTEGTP